MFYNNPEIYERKFKQNVTEPVNNEHFPQNAIKNDFGNFAFS